MIATRDDRILITGAGGFVGVKVVRNLLDRGYRNLRCFARSADSAAKLEGMVRKHGYDAVEVFTGNLLSREACIQATKDVAVVYHLAAGRGEKSVPDAFMNSVVTTRNLLDAVVQHRSAKRFVSISSFSVYSNRDKRQRRLLDESCPIEARPELRGDAYCFAKVRQDEMVTEYHERHGVPAVIVRPGWVYGPGNEAITGRVGIGTFGLFLHLGGGNPLPASYVDNCAEAIVLAGIVPGVDGEVFNVVDDDFPSSRRFLWLYKKNVKRFPSVYVPHALSYLLCALWEKYSVWSDGQLPPSFNRLTWHAYWKSTRYSNEKAKRKLGWTPGISTVDGLQRYFESCRSKRAPAS